MVGVGMVVLEAQRLSPDTVSERMLPTGRKRAARWAMSQTRPDRAPDLSGLSRLDLKKPSAARVYDYYLGGTHNFAVDREFAEQAIALVPELPWIMRINRAYLRRAVRYMVEVGIRQFIDLGSGIPTVGNVHQVVEALTQDAKVIYVDNDPVAVTHSSQILTSRHNAIVIPADVREPEKIFEHSDVRRLVDPAKPVGVLMFAILHFVSDSDDPRGVIARYRHHMVPDSHIALSHATRLEGDESMAEHRKMYDRSSNPMTMRTMDEVRALMEGFEIVPPGVVYMPLWRPDPGEAGLAQPERSSGYAAVGRVA